MMQWALARANRNNIRLTDGGVPCMKLSKSVAQTSFNIIGKDHEAVTTLNNCEQRCIFLTFFTLELDEHWRSVAPFLMRLQGSEKINLFDPKVNGKMDGLDPVQSATSSHVGQQRAHRSHGLDPAQSAIFFLVGQHRVPNSQLLEPGISPELVTPCNLSRMNALEHVQNRIAEKNQNRAANFYSNSLRTISDPLNVSPEVCSSGTVDSANQFNAISKAEKTQGRSSRNKAKKKRKHKKTSPKNVSSTHTKNESIQGNSLYDAGCHVHLDCANADDLVIKSLQMKECTLQDSVVDTDTAKNIEYLSSEVYFATSKSSGVDESNVEEESCTYPASEDSLSETLKCKVKGLQEGCLGHASSTQRSVQSTDEALAPCSLKSSSIKNCGEIAVGKFPKEDATCITDQLLHQWFKSGSSADMSTRASSEEQKQPSTSDCGISDGINYSTTSDITPSSIECLSHENACNLTQDMHEIFHVKLGKFTKGSMNGADGIRCNSGNCSTVDEYEFVPNWKVERANKSTEGSSGPAQRFSGYANTNEQGGKDRNRFLWQKVSRHGGKETSSFPENPNHGKLPKDDASEISSSSIRKGVYWKKSKKKRSNNCTRLHETSVQSEPQETDPLPLTEGETTNNKSSEMQTLKSISESNQEQASHTKTSFPDRNSLESSKVREIAFHTVAMEVSSQSVHNRKSASGCSHYDPCSTLDATLSVIADSCSSSSVHDTQTDLTIAHLMVKPCYLVEKSFENELKMDSGTVFHKDVKQSCCPSTINDDHKQALTISNQWQVHRDNEQNLESGDANICEEQKGVPHSLDPLSLADAGSECCVTSKSSVPFHGDLKESEKSSIYIANTCTVDANIIDVTNSCLNHTPVNQRKSVSEDALDKILEAIHETYTIQMESEDIQLATGNHLADFEEVLHAASPIFSSSTFSVCSCGDCLSRDHRGNLLRMHQVPDHTLGAIWQWYEEPGCYGLKVKIKECQSLRRLGPNQHESYAYFVPLLSAVQLFVRSRSSSSSSIRGIPGTETEFLKEPPRLRCTTVSSSCKAESETYESTAETYSGESVLLFEYFESEKPQQRKPVFEKIKELVKADASSYLQMYGDSSYLENLSLRDLHQASWYSVAWYPIFRMPDDSFRTAFLTYHSLGHFTTRSSLLDSPCEKRSFVVSPVIGLQPYNPQGEGWFSLKNPTTVTARKNQHVDPTVVLEKRLRTLEQAASKMSTAAVQKGEHISVNMHPDYEFFVSRRW